MKRLHVNLSVENIEESMRFYTALFNTDPIVRKEDYVKWSLDDPGVNFAINLSEKPVGLNHLGFEFDNASDLEGFNERIQQEDQFRNEGHTVCCYAQSEKSWLTDPQQVEWEFFHTYGTSETNSSVTTEKEACCEPTCC